MLTDLQIERYCRQIILPEVGSAGQERLLQASVLLHGAGGAISLCAGYLAGAGVGTLATASRDDALAATITRRNPDCRIAEELAEPTLVVSLGDALPSAVAPRAALVWGGSGPTGVRIARFAPGLACIPCLRAVAERDAGGSDDGALGTLAALEALRVLLGFAPLAGTSLVSIDLARGATAASSFPSRPDCPRCRRPEVADVPIRGMKQS